MYLLDKMYGTRIFGDYHPCGWFWIGLKESLDFFSSIEAFEARSTKENKSHKFDWSPYFFKIRR